MCPSSMDSDCGQTLDSGMLPLSEVGVDFIKV